jgi:hypothetical protein
VKDVIILTTAAGIAGGIVWRLTAGAGASLRPRVHRPVRFEESFEVTALPVVEAGYGVTAGASLAFEESAAEPSRPVWSAVRLVLLILGLAGIGAAGIYTVAHFVNKALADKLTGT